MANGFQGPPAVDFYSMLSGLGDTIAKNRQDQAKRDAFAAATVPGPDGKIEYGKAILGLAQADPHAAALLAQIQNHNDALKQQDREFTRNTANDTFSHGIQTEQLGLSKRTADRLDDPTPAGFVRGSGDKSNTLMPLTGGPADPAYIAAKEKASADASVGKPIPFETLSGTKFLVRQPDGTYAKVDPSSIGSPVASTPKVVGDAEGVRSGLYDPPVAPGLRPPVQGAAPPPQMQPVAAANPDFASRFQGQPSQPVQAQPPVDTEAVDTKTGRRENWLKSQPPDVQAYIKKIADYEVDPRTTSIKGGHREQVLSAVAQYDPTYDQNSFGSRAKAIKDFATGQQGNTIRSFDVAIDHLATLERYAKAMQSGDSRLINTIRNTWREATGSELPTDFRAVAPIVGAEVSKAIIGSNNALADREELRKPLALASSPEQIAGAAGAYRELMAGQLKGLKKQYEDTTGKKDFDKRLRENTLKALSGKTEGSAPDSPNVTSTGVKWSIQ